MLFKSRTDGWFPILILGKSILLVTFIISKIFNNGISITPIVIISSILIFIVWVHFSTRYEITSSKLNYKSGFLNGDIDISKIKEIIDGKTLWIGIRPATATKGLIVKFNHYDEVYISPKTNQDFIQEILKINPTIKITKA